MRSKRTGPIHTLAKDPCYDIIRYISNYLNMSLSKTFNAFSDPNRQKILDLLKEKELAVADIAKNLDITLATLSHHLDVLKKAELISRRRQGKQVFYSLNLSVVEEITEKIIKFLAVKKKK